MITSHRGPLKRAVAGVTAGLLAFSGLALAATPASAQPGFEFERLSGPDRFATAADIAIETFGTADTVLLATGLKFPDALTGNFLAGAIDDTPILLTFPDDLPQVTSDALETLGATNVIILGGVDAVSDAVEDELDADFDVERLSGPTRYDTAEVVAKRAASNSGTVGMSDTSTVGMFDGRRTAVLGSGENFPDVLAAGPLGYAAGFPLTITFPTDLPDPTVDVLEDLEIEQVIIVGGTDAVSAAVEAEAEQITGNPARRVSGETRFETAAEIADFAYDELDFDVTHVNLARGDDGRVADGERQGFADALTGGPHAGEDPSPIVLTNPNDLPPATRMLLEERCPTLTDGHIFGGFLAVSQAVEDDAEFAASNCAPAPVVPTPTPTPTPPPATATTTIALTDAVVATDSADSAGATDTASAGDVFELTFDEAIATDTADGVRITVEDGDGDTAVIECGADETVIDDQVIAADCEVSPDGTLLTITLLEDFVDNGQQLDFPLTITAVTGLADDAGNVVDPAAGDDQINVDANTQVSP